MGGGGRSRDIGAGPPAKQLTADDGPRYDTIIINFIIITYVVRHDLEGHTIK